jgi:hypothetical protein
MDWNQRYRGIYLRVINSKLERREQPLQQKHEATREAWSMAQTSGAHYDFEMAAESIIELTGHAQAEGMQEGTQRLSTEMQRLKDDTTRAGAILFFHRATNKGMFWIPMEELWATEYVAVPDLKFVQFERTDSKITALFASNYLATSEDAFKDTTIEADISPASISLSYRPKRKDIFGNVKPGCHLPDTYLLPASPMSARNWYNVIPWILPNIPENDTMSAENVEDRADKESEWMRRMSKCVHGSKIKESDGMASYHRNPGSGIIHFRTNRVHIYAPSMLNEQPSLVIVPILTAESARNWNGEGYDAIVVAAGTNEVTASNVYERVEAGLCISRFDDDADLDINLMFATDDEVETARSLLSDVVENLSLKWCEGSASKSNHVPFWPDGVPVPAPKEASLSRIGHVRKVTFVDAREKTVKEHPAPDPILLVLKAAANWYGLPLLGA